MEKRLCSGYVAASRVCGQRAVCPGLGDRGAQSPQQHPLQLCQEQGAVIPLNKGCLGHQLSGPDKELLYKMLLQWQTLPLAAEMWSLQGIVVIQTMISSVLVTITYRT